MEQLAGAARRHTRVVRPSLSVGVADSPEVIRAAKELRYRIFAEEMGARLPTAIIGVDHDAFDAHCQHLVVQDDASGEVVGTCRILTPESASRIAITPRPSSISRASSRCALSWSRSVAPVSIPTTAAAPPSRCSGLGWAGLGLQPSCNPTITRF